MLNAQHMLLLSMKAAIGVVVAAVAAAPTAAGFQLQRAQTSHVAALMEAQQPLTARM
jgi:hypothetical protein